MSPALLSGIGLILAVAVLFILAFKNFHGIYVAAAAAVVLALFSGLDPWGTVSQSMMGGMADYIKNYYMLFLAGAVLGQVYHITGAGITIANAILKIFGSKNACLAIMLFGYIAIMGGIQSFVAFFAVYPVALHIFQKADINIALLPAIMGGGMWTMGHVSPWAPSVANQVASDALGTTSSAGWVPGLLYTVVSAILIVLYGNHAAKKLRANGEGFTSHADLQVIEESKLPNLFAAFAPILSVFVIYNFLKVNVTLSTWAGVVIGIVVFARLKTLTEWKEAITEGAKSGSTVAVNTALVVAVGGVIAMTPFYDALINWVANVNMNPFVLAVLASGILAAVTASASGAVTIVYRLLGPTFLEYGAAGYNLGFIHRISVQSLSCFDSLPHCGPLLGLFTVCKVTHKQAYKHVFVTTILIPIIACYGFQLPFAMIFGGP